MSKESIYPLQIVFEGDVAQAITYEIDKEVGSLSVMDITEVSTKQSDWKAIIKEYLTPNANAALVDEDADHAIAVGNCHVVIHPDYVDIALALAEFKVKTAE